MKSEIYRKMLIVVTLLVLAILSFNVSTTSAKSLEEAYVLFNNEQPQSFLDLRKADRLSYMSSGMQFEATVYNDSGHAADGTYVYEGMIAADPYVLPIGTQVYVEFYGPYSHMSGVYTVHDVGGAVVGNVIDVWVPWDEYEMDNFGRRYVSVTVL